MRGWRRWATGLPVLAVLAGVPATAAARPVVEPVVAAAPATAVNGARIVTLPSGDRVSVSADKRISFLPGNGRPGARYATETTDGHLFVIPADELRSVASGKLGRDRFDVTRLAGLAGPLPAQHRAEKSGAETVKLTVRYLDTNGRPAAEYLSRIRGVDDGSYQDLYDEDGTVEVTLPKGRYVLDAWVRTDLDTKPKDHLLVAPGLDLTADTTVNLDTRLSRPQDVTVENRSVRAVQAMVGYTRLGGPLPIAGGLTTEDPAALYSAQIGPALPASELVSQTLSRWAVPGPGRDFRNTPVSYGLMNVRRGSVFTGFHRRARNGGLAVIRAQHNAQIANRTAVAGYSVLLPEQYWALGYLFAYDQPTAVTDYLEGGREWGAQVNELTPDHTDFATQQYWPTTRTFVAGRHYTEVWNAAVFAPAFSTQYDAERDGEYLAPYVAPYSDRAGHSGWSQTDTASTKLYRNGELVAEGNEAGTLPRGVTVPPERAAYRLTTVADRPSWSDFSTHIEQSWTFESQVTTERTPLPLWAIRFLPRVDSRNRAEAGPVTELPVALQPVPLADVGTVAAPSVEISGDDGKTWRRATVTKTGSRRYVAKAATPGHPAYISVRAKAHDSDGNTVEETIIHAYALHS